MERPPELEDHVAGAITVYESTELRVLPFVTLEQLLRHGVSLQVSSQSLLGRQSFPAVRGGGQAFGSSIVLRVDGQRVEDSFYGSPFVYARHFPLERIGRLVIYRGTAAAAMNPEAAELFIDIETRSDATEATLALGQNGSTAVSLTGGGGGHLAFSAGELRLRMWADAIDDDGSRQKIEDAVNRPIKTIDPFAALSYGGLFQHGGFFVGLHGAHYAARRGLVYGFKSHSNRVSTSYLTLMTGVQGEPFGAPSRLSLQLVQGRVNALGLIVPRGIRVQTIQAPLTEDYFLNEWMREYRVALEGATQWPLSDRLTVHASTSASWSVVDKAKQQGTHDPQTFEFKHALAEYGERATNIPRGAYREAFEARVGLQWRGDSVSWAASIGMLQFKDRGFFSSGFSPRGGFPPRASIRWDYCDSGVVWASAALSQDAPPLAIDHYHNHPLIYGQSKHGAYSDLNNPMSVWKMEAGFVQGVLVNGLEVEMVAFREEGNQLHHRRLLTENEPDNLPCSTAECVPLRFYSTLHDQYRLGIEGSLRGRFEPVMFDLYAMNLFDATAAGGVDFSHRSAGLRTVAIFGSHSISAAASAFDAFVGEPPYVTVDARWSYRFAPWGRVAIVASNITDSKPGGLPRSMPRGYPSRGRAVTLQFESRNDATE